MSPETWAEPLEHDPVHSADSDLFYVACRRCLWLLRIRDEGWRLPGRRAVELIVDMAKSRPLPTAAEVRRILADEAES
jgi:hypothetical protein